MSIIASTASIGKSSLFQSGILFLIDIFSIAGSAIGAITLPGLLLLVMLGIISGVSFPLIPFERSSAINPRGSGCDSNFSLTPLEARRPAAISCGKISPHVAAIFA